MNKANRYVRQSGNFMFVIFGWLNFTRRGILYLPLRIFGCTFRNGKDLEWHTRAHTLIKLHYNGYMLYSVYYTQHMRIALLVLPCIFKLSTISLLLFSHSKFAFVIDNNIFVVVCRYSRWSFSCIVFVWIVCPNQQPSANSFVLAILEMNFLYVCWLFDDYI